MSQTTHPPAGPAATAADLPEGCLAALDGDIDAITAADPDGALVPVLQAAQRRFGWLPQPVLRHIARRLGKPLSEVTGVVSFYSFFSTRPRGRHVVRVCLGTACYVRGGKDVLASLEKALGIGVGQTTADRQFTLEIGRCFGACGLAPVVMVDDDVHQRVRPARIKELLSAYAAAPAQGKGVA